MSGLGTGVGMGAAAMPAPPSPALSHISAAGGNSAGMGIGGGDRSTFSLGSGASVGSSAASTSASASSYLHQQHQHQHQPPPTSRSSVSGSSFVAGLSTPRPPHLSTPAAAGTTTGSHSAFASRAGTPLRPAGAAAGHSHHGAAGIGGVGDDKQPPQHSLLQLLYGARIVLRGVRLVLFVCLLVRLPCERPLCSFLSSVHA